MRVVNPYVDTGNSRSTDLRHAAQKNASSWFPETKPATEWMEPEPFVDAHRIVASLDRNVSAKRCWGEAVALTAETFSIRRQEGSRWRFAADADQLWDLNARRRS